MQPRLTAVPPVFSPRQIGLLRAAGAASVVVAVMLIGLKLWAWQRTGSVALLSSLADSLLDLVASLITFFAVRVAVTPADREHRFGHGKSEGIASLAQAIIVTGSALFVGVEAIVRLLAPRQIMEPGVGLVVMLASLVLTIVLVAFQKHVVRSTGSLAIGADAVHYQSDILTAIAVLAAIFLNYQFSWYAADPLLGLVIVGVILASVRTIVFEAVDVLLDRELPSRTRREIIDIASRHPAVLGVHDIRTRSAGSTQFIQLHLELDPGLSLEKVHEISNEVQLQVLNSFPKAEVLIHADPYGFPDARDFF
ncbi:MAG TPA: cation diffusion facilitator family transporter [Gammaproteobacteria bacterium]|nr:cation diffusion facilitator family transporter [Gammaproteobacteria bacterium]